MGTAGGLYRLDGNEWSRVADAPEGGWTQWMIATPGGGVAMSVPSGEEGAHRIVRLDVDQWLDDTGDIRFSAAVTRNDQPRILGYDMDDNLVDIRFINGSVEVSTARREFDGSGPGFTSIPLTVDVDSEGAAWFGTVVGAWRFDGETARLTDFGVRGNCCSPLAVDADDNVWIHIDTGSLFRLSPTGEQTAFTREDGIPFLGNLLAIVPTADGTVWLFEHGDPGTVGRVAHFDGAAWTSYPATEAMAAGLPTITSLSAAGILDGPDGSTWLIRHRDPGGPLIHRYWQGEWAAVPSTGIERGLSNADYGTLGTAVGPDGSFWIPTGTGVARFQPSGD
jgi:hypothetical protein